MSNIVSPFVNIKLHSLVVLYPYQLNNEIYFHLKNNLKKQIENKCNNIGYICKINELIEYNHGYVEPEDFSGNILYNVVFNATVCIPVKDTEIICKVDTIHKQLIIATVGPIKCIIKTTEINLDKFEIQSNGNIINKLYNKVIKVNDYIRVIIKSHKSYVGEDKIGVMGYINDIPTQEEIKTYFYKELIDDDNTLVIENNNFINMNEDESIDISQNEKKNTILEI